ncbi:MAG: carbohydrate porin [Simkaniaceae bacterium]|nr:carbohydrate porin [Simkaniaceae bacterium]
MRFHFFLLPLILASISLQAVVRKYAEHTEIRHEKQKEIFRETLGDTQGKKWADWEYMSGNWNGARTTLAKNGVTIGATYVTDILGNPVGGMAQGIAYAGSFGFDINVDFGMMGKIPGLEFYSSVVWRTGTNLSADKIGNQFTVAQLYGGQNVRLNELFLKQTLFDKKLILKAGRLDVGNDFLQSPLYYFFINNAFDGNPVAVFINGFFSAYPNATWGAFADVQPIKELSAKFAVYNANAEVSENKYHGLNFSFHNTQGALVITEWAYLLNHAKSSTGMPGKYRAGVYYLTGETDKLLGGSEKGYLSYYVLLDQMVYRAGERALAPFIALLFAPKDKAIFPFFFTSGLIFKGLFTAREQDSTSLGVTYGTYSKDLRKAQRMAKKVGVPGAHGDREQNFEMVIELNHWFQITKWFVVTPDIQYIINPRGLGTIQNALVLGAQIGVTF